MRKISTKIYWLRVGRQVRIIRHRIWQRMSIERARGTGSRRRVIEALVMTILLGLATATMLYSFSYLTRDVFFFGDVAESGLDRRMQLLEGGGSTSHPRMVFVDFDDASMRELGYPALVPHSTLANLIDRLKQARPALVILDIDISRHQDSHSHNLARALNDLGASGINTLLARAVVAMPESTDGKAVSLPEFAETPFDAVVEQNPRLQWISVNMVENDDGVVRGLTPWTAGCAGTKPVVYPGVQLAVLLQFKSDFAKAKRLFQQNAAAWKLQCGKPIATVVNQRMVFDLVAPRNRVTISEANSVIDYSFSWERRGKEAVVLPLPASGPTLSGAPLNGELLSDAIIIIGASAADRLDIHRTPLGSMPGSYILLNASRAWLDHGPNAPNGFIAGMVLIWVTTGFSTLLAVLAIVFAKPRWRSIIEILMPPLLTFLTWIVLLLLGDTTTATVLFFIQYLVMLIMILASMHRKQSEPLQGQFTE